MNDVMHDPGHAILPMVVGVMAQTNEHVRFVGGFRKSIISKNHPKQSPQTCLRSFGLFSEN